MERFLRFDIEQIPLIAAVLIIAFTVHEFAHAYTAYKLGDTTAKDQGRLTLNPIQHLDPIGTLLIFIFGFGWARPVPVKRRNFKNPRLGGIIVSLMGPLSNFALAVIGTGILVLFSANFPPMLVEFLLWFNYFNVLLFVFNLLPLQPLDGYRILEDLVSPSVRAKMTQYEQYGSLVFLILVITPLGSYTIYPILNTVIPYFVSNLQNMFLSLL
ncbi:site-2 protease family protein [Lederbergia graminis]|uniref:Site-2 protease family protein n=1 Tax=Lederbergia graminis TaxID=735518 RepID=A0ABW0LKT5_9BACI